MQYACDGKHNEIENERKRQNLDMRYPSSIKREKRQRPVNETTEKNGAPLRTTLYNLPLEILDIILQKSYLHWILNSATKQRDEEVIRSLTSVDECFYQRITRRRFKKAVWRYLKAFYGKTKKRYAIIRNHRNYLMENIKPSKELVSSMLSLDCITLKESHLIQRQHSDRDKNDKLMNAMRSFNEEKFSNCVKCLRRSKQKTVASIIENGGGVIRIQVRSCGENYTESMVILQQLHQKIEDHRNKAIPWSHRMNRSISQLSDKGIEILNSQLGRQTVVVWIWCHSQAALEYMQRMYESNQLRDEFCEVIQPLTSKIIDISRNQFKKTVVVRAIAINLTRRIEYPRNKGNRVRGVTKLRNEIYILNYDPRVILVFEDRNAFLLQKEIKLNEIKDPWDVGSSEKDNCLYVVDLEECVWKISRETADEYKIIKWLTTDYTSFTLSVSSDDQLLLVDYSSSILWIYGSDAELIRSIQLSKDINRPEHAEKTSIGNFIISHIWMTGERKKAKLCSRSNGREEIMVDEQEDEKDKEEKNDAWKNNKAKEKKENDEKGNEMAENKEVGLYEIHDEQNEGVKRNAKVDEKKIKEEKEEEGWFYGSTVSELTSDGQMVVRRFIPSNESQAPVGPLYLSIDSDDQVFMANSFNHRVILLDSDLKWNRTLLSAEDEDGEMVRNPHRLCYDDENKQLIVAVIDAINVYSIIRI